MVATILLAVAQLAVALEGVAYWRFLWMSAFDHAGAAFFYTGPLVSGVAAWRLLHARLDLADQLTPTRIRVRAWAAEALVGWLAAVVAYLIMLGCVAVVCLVSGASGPTALAVVAPLQLSYLSAAVAAGWAVAGVFSWRGAPLVAAVAVFILVFASLSGVLPGRLVDFAGASSFLVVMHHNGVVVGAQLLFAWSLVALFAGVALTRLGALPRWLSVVPVALALLVAISGTRTAATSDLDRFVSEPVTASDYRCQGSGPEVCLHRDAESLRAVVNTQAERIWAALGDGVWRPRRLVQATPDDRAGLPGRHLFLSPGIVNSPASVSPYVVWRSECLDPDRPPPGRGADELLLFEEAVLVRADAATADFDPAATRLASLPDARWRPLADRVMRAADRCDFIEIARERALRLG